MPRGANKLPIPADAKYVAADSKKRGADKVRDAAIAENRKKYRNLANIPVAEIATTIDPNKPLTEKARLFAKFWGQGESISSATLRAGYAQSTFGYQLAHMPQVRAIYEEEKRLFEEANQMTRKKVMDGLLEGIEMAKLVGEPTAVINGWKTVGQMCGYFEPVKKKLEITVKGQLALQKMETLSDSDLIQLMEQQLPELVQEVEGDGDAPQED